MKRKAINLLAVGALALGLAATAAPALKAAPTITYPPTLALLKAAPTMIKAPPTLEEVPTFAMLKSPPTLNAVPA